MPGDKSVSHRALILASSVDGEVPIVNLNDGRDVAATLAAIEAIGARVKRQGHGSVVVGGGSLRSPRAAMDCANSGSTARMMLGACAGANLSAIFDGDASLRGRPMEPAAAQLRAFGAKIETTDGRLPMTLSGTPRIETRNFILLGPSAQVKSALLFAGLFARTPITIAGDRRSRDHTERLLRFLGAGVTWDGRTIALREFDLAPRRIDVAGDVSAAAFFIAAATIAPGSDVIVPSCGVNPTRTGLIDALRRMGADIEIANHRESAGEPVADVRVRHAPLHAIAVDSELAFRAIDEIPLLAVAAAFASGTTKISGIHDLRAKESDRIAAIEGLLSAVGVRGAATGPNAMEIEGGTPSARENAIVETFDDHRIAMAAAVLACACGPLTIDSDASVAVSFPGFTERLARAQA